MSGFAEGYYYAIPSPVIHHFNVVQAEVGFLTRDLDHEVTTVGYSDFRKTSDIDIVFLDSF